MSCTPLKLLKSHEIADQKGRSASLQVQHLLKNQDTQVKAILSLLLLDIHHLPSSCTEKPSLIMLGLLGHTCLTGKSGALAPSTRYGSCNPFIWPCAFNMDSKKDPKHDFATALDIVFFGVVHVKLMIDITRLILLLNNMLHPS